MFIIISNFKWKQKEIFLLNDSYYLLCKTKQQTWPQPKTENVSNHKRGCNFLYLLWKKNHYYYCNGKTRLKSVWKVFHVNVMRTRFPPPWCLRAQGPLSIPCLHLSSTYVLHVFREKRIFCNISKPATKQKLFSQISCNAFTYKFTFARNCPPIIWWPTPYPLYKMC